MRKSIIAVLALAVGFLASSCEKDLVEPIVEAPLEGPEIFIGTWVDASQDRTIIINEDLNTIIYQDSHMNAKARDVVFTNEEFGFTVKYSVGSQSTVYQLDLAGILIDNNAVELTQVKFVSNTPVGKSEVDIPVDFGIYERRE